jgi:hypothetical protein
MVCAVPGVEVVGWGSGETFSAAGVLCIHSFIHSFMLLTGDLWQKLIQATPAHSKCR